MNFTVIERMTVSEGFKQTVIRLKICVFKGSLKFYGFSERRGKVEQEEIIETNESLVSPPQYWHKVELLDKGTQFKVEFYAQRDSDIAKQHLSERDSNTF